MRIAVRHNTHAAAMASLCGRAGLDPRTIAWDPKAPTGPVTGRADAAALDRLRRTRFVVAIEDLDAGAALGVGA